MDGQRDLLQLETLAFARERVIAGRERGMICPCCDQFIKVYNRKLNSAMAYSLILIHRYFQRPDAEEWLHVERYLKPRPQIDCHDFPKLRFWNLLKAMQGTRDDGSKRMGFYKITDLGIRFAQNQSRLPKRAAIVIDTAIGFSDETTNIVEALGSRFNYLELMNAELDQHY